MAGDSSSTSQVPSSGGGNHNGVKSLATGNMPPSSSSTAAAGAGGALASTAALGIGADAIGSAGGGSGGPEGQEDLNVFVQDLLDQMQTRFSQMGDSILGRIDAMGDQIDELERSVKDLMDQAGVDPPSSAGAGVSHVGGGSAAVDGADSRRTG